MCYTEDKMERKSQQLYLMSSFRGRGVAEMVMNDIERKLEKNADEIKILYITTAGNLHAPEKRDWINEGREILLSRGWQVFDCDIAGKTEEEVADALRDKDVVFVQGGNNFYLLKQMHDCNFAEIIKSRLLAGMIYMGESAGAIVCAQDIAEQRFISGDAFDLVPDLDDFRGLGLVNFLFKPHWNREGAKREKFSKFIRENPEEFYSIKQPIICLNDNQLVYVDGDKFQIWEG